MQHLRPHGFLQTRSLLFAKMELFITEDGIYTSREKVAEYLRTYGKLPANFITKTEAQNLGWSGGSLLPYAKYKCKGEQSGLFIPATV